MNRPLSARGGDGGRGGANFQKNRGVGGGELDRISMFRGESLGKRGVTFFRGWVAVFT